MRTDELESLLACTSIEEVVAAIDDPALQAQRGWDLRGWTSSMAPSSLCLLHSDEQGNPLDMLVVVREPRTRRERLAGLLVDLPVSAKLVLIE
jgi:hypothetical protein